MTHHKRKRPKSARAGCLWCKPHKHQRVGKAKRRTHADRKRIDQERVTVSEGGER